MVGRPPSPPPRTKWTRRVPHPVLIGHAASLRWGGEALKEACAALGIKAGGTPGERAARLLRTSGVPRAGWDKALLVSSKSIGKSQMALGGKWKRRREEGESEAETGGAGEGAA